MTSRHACAGRSSMADAHDHPHRDPRRRTRTGRRRPARQRLRRGAPPWRAGHRRRPGHGDDVRRGGRRRRLHRRRHRGRAGARPRRARHGNGAAAAAFLAVMPERAIGRDTVAAMQSGAVIGHIGLVCVLIRRDRVQSCRPTADGRRASWSPAASRRRRGRDMLGERRRHRPVLTLEGLALLHAEVGSGRRSAVSVVSSTAGFILLGVTGSIAAYKAAELARALIAAGADVQVLMTPHRDALPRAADARDAHAPTGRCSTRSSCCPTGASGTSWPPTPPTPILVAPATARWLAAMANGLADDVITATCLASTAPVVVAPAMDGEMYAHPATRANVEQAASLRLHDRRARGRAAGVGRRSARAGWPSCRASSRRSIGRVDGRADPRSPTRACGRPWRRLAGEQRPGRLARRRHRRRHGRADRPGPLHRQSLERADGRRDRRGGARARRARDAHPRHGQRAAPGRRRARRRARPRPRCARRCWPRSPTRTRWSWPPPWPTSGPRQPRHEAARERRPDARARADRGHPGRGRRAGQRGAGAGRPTRRVSVPRPRRLRGRDRLARARAGEGRAQGRRPARRQRRRRAGLGLRHRHQSGDASSCPARRPSRGR